MTKAQINFYTKFCKFFNQFTFLKRFGGLFQSKKLSEIAKYLNENFGLLPNEIITTSFTIFLLLFIPLIIIFLQMNILLGIIIPILVSYVVANRILNYPISKYNQIQYILLQYSDLAFQDLFLILNTTNSIFDAILFISKAQYPFLSEKFGEMISEINFNRKTPESLISEFIGSLPNGNLKERLITVMATKLRPDKMLEQLESLAGEKKFEYAAATQQLESKLIVVMALCIFIPVVIALFISFLGPASNFLSIFMIPIYILVIQKFRTQILKTHFELFGESKDELGSNNSQLIEFLHFLTYFGNELKRGVPQELALLKGIRSYHGVLKNSIEKYVLQIYYEGNSFKECWNKFKNTVPDPQIHFLIDLICRMIDKSSIETGIRIISTLQQLKANRELIQERDGIIKAQQFKVKALIFISAAILGLIAGLTPFLMKFNILLVLPEGQVNFSFGDSLPLTLSLCIMGIYSGYYLAKIVRIHRPSLYLLWWGLTFTILCYISSTTLLA